MTTPLAVEDTPAMLHSIAEFFPLLKPLFESGAIRTVCEIGAENGTTSAALSEYRRAGILDHITVVDTALSNQVMELGQDSHVTLISKSSLVALLDLHAHDLYIIDGDHNYYTVLNELRLIHATNQNAIVLLHDVGWPWGRRDLYYDPNNLPKSAVRPHTFKHGVVPNKSGVIHGGMVSLGRYAVALNEGGPENGVLTAVEDFLTKCPRLQYLSIPVIHGLGIIYPDNHRLAPLLLREVMPSAGCLELLRRLEANRLRNWLALIDMQDRLRACSVSNP